jgi:sugar-specific transcriptional regulator TrmB
MVLLLIWAEILSGNNIARKEFELINAAKNEVLKIFPTPNSFYLNQKDIIDLLKEIAVQRNVSVRILSPVDDRVRRTITRNTKQKVLKIEGEIAHCSVF